MYFEAQRPKSTAQCLFMNWSKQNFKGVFSQGDRAERGALCFPPLRIQPRSVEKVTLLSIHPNIKIQHPLLPHLRSIFFIKITQGGRQPL